MYLGLSENELYELRHPPPAAQGVEGPIFVKHIKRGAVGQNQPVLYFLGELRQYLGRLRGSTSHQVALNSGILSWVSATLPFFVLPGFLGIHLLQDHSPLTGLGEF